MTPLSEVIPVSDLQSLYRALGLDERTATLADAVKAVAAHVKLLCQRTDQYLGVTKRADLLEKRLDALGHSSDAWGNHVPASPDLTAEVKRIKGGEPWPELPPLAPLLERIARALESKQPNREADKCPGCGHSRGWHYDDCPAFGADLGYTLAPEKYKGEVEALRNLAAEVGRWIYIAGMSHPRTQAAYHAWDRGKGKATDFDAARRDAEALRIARATVPAEDARIHAATGDMTSLCGLVLLANGRIAHSYTTHWSNATCMDCMAQMPGLRPTPGQPPNADEFKAMREAIEKGRADQPPLRDGMRPQSMFQGAPEMQESVARNLAADVTEENARTGGRTVTVAYKNEYQRLLDLASAVAKWKHDPISYHDEPWRTYLEWDKGYAPLLNRKHAADVAPGDREHCNAKAAEWVGREMGRRLRAREKSPNTINQADDANNKGARE